MAGYDEDEDWVGEPPEGHYTRDRANPDFWRRPWPLAGIGLVVLVVVFVIIIVVH